jgi:glycosyltransferase involved in cell wall biosynthesis
MEAETSKISKKNSQDHPLVSIITPTYNHAKFIGTCIESVLKQTYQNWEMIIIDDGSTDGTDVVVARYDDDRIKYVKQENQGIWKLNENYNKALKISKGSLIAVLEGDDAWPTFKLEEQVKIFNKADIVLSWGRMNTINDKNEIISFDSHSLEHFIDMRQEDLIKNMVNANFIQACTVMIDKKALLSIGGFLQYENTPYVDYPTFLELSLKGRFYPSDKVLGFWRKHNAQVTSKQQTEMNKSFMCSLEFYEKLDPSLQRSIQFDIDDKLKYNEKMLNDQIAVSARLLLVKGKWKEAMTQYKSIFGKTDLTLKLQSFLGIICAILRINIEWFAVITCKPKLRDSSGEWDSTIYNNNKNLSIIFKIQIYSLKIISVIIPHKYPNYNELIVQGDSWGNERSIEVPL